MAPLTLDARRAAARLAVAVFTATALGYALALPLLPARGVSVAAADNVAAAFKWAAITCIVVATPTVAAGAKVGAERILGTLVGGAAGFAAYSATNSLDVTPGVEVGDGLLLAAMAAAVAFTTSVVGARYGLPYSSKLSAQAFVIVAFGASAKEVSPAAAGGLALSRVLGITAGVVLVELASVALWPTAATTKALSELRRGLALEAGLADDAWRAALAWARAETRAPAPAPSPPRGRGSPRPAAASPFGGAGGGDAATPLLADAADPEAAAALLPPETVDTATADAVSASAAAVTAALDASLALAATTASEVYLELPWGAAMFLPGTPWGPVGPHGRPLDPALLAAAVAAARDVARALAALHAARPRTGAYAPLLAATYPPALLEGAAADATAVLRELAASFPRPPPPSARQAALRVRARAAALLRISDYAKRALQRAATRGVRASSEALSVDGGGGGEGAAPDAAGSPTDALDELPADLASALSDLERRGEAPPPAADAPPAAASPSRRRSLARLSSSHFVASAFPPTAAGFEAHVRWLASQLAMQEVAAELGRLVDAVDGLAGSLPAALRRV